MFHYLGCVCVITILFSIQKWIKFLKTAPETVIVELEKCSNAIVNQLNNFPNFIPIQDLRIKSFFAPYYSELEDKTIYKLLEVDQFNGDFSSAPVLSGKDGEVLEFDEIASKYFAFLNR